jgi:hypothetical protein
MPDFSASPTPPIASLKAPIPCTAAATTPGSAAIAPPACASAGTNATAPPANAPIAEAASPTALTIAANFSPIIIRPRPPSAPLKRPKRPRQVIRRAPRAALLRAEVIVGAARRTRLPLVLLQHPRLLLELAPTRRVAGAILRVTDALDGRHRLNACVSIFRIVFVARSMIVNVPVMEAAMPAPIRRALTRHIIAFRRSTASSSANSRTAVDERLHPIG